MLTKSSIVPAAAVRIILQGTSLTVTVRIVKPPVDVLASWPSVTERRVGGHIMTYKMDGWLWSYGILSMQIATVSCLK